MARDYLIDEATGEPYIEDAKGKVRIDIRTGKKFVKGATRGDGAIFQTYKKTYHSETNFRQERWRTARPEGTRRLNPKTGKEFTIRDTRDEDNKLFWRYNNKDILLNGFYAEMWKEPVTTKCAITFCKETYLDIPQKPRTYCHKHMQGKIDYTEHLEHGFKDCFRDQDIAKRTGCQGKDVPIIKYEDGTYNFNIRTHKRDGRKIFASECRTCSALSTRRFNMMKNFGINLDQYDDQLQKQDGVCAICKGDEPREYASLAIDHDHQTGILRGLLCHHCNAQLPDRAKEGHDEIALLLRMVRYLQMADLAKKGLIKDFVFSNTPNDDMNEYKGFLSDGLQEK